MARSESPVRAATLARISSGLGPANASFSIGRTAIACSARRKAAALSPRPMLVNAGLQRAGNFPAGLWRTTPVHCVLFARLLRRRHDRPRGLAPILTKNAVH